MIFLILFGVFMIISFIIQKKNEDLSNLFATISIFFLILFVITLPKMSVLIQILGILIDIFFLLVIGSFIILEIREKFSFFYTMRKNKIAKFLLLEKSCKDCDFYIGVRDGYCPNFAIPKLKICTKFEPRK